MYFEYNEGENHEKAKNKLYDLIVERRVLFMDQDGNEYRLFMNKHKDEFLHMESFIVDYSNKALFSGSDLPCIKYIDNPLCSQEGYYGAFKELPCHKCVLNNIDDNLIKGSSRFASYRPDIAFGFEGIHKVWIEIVDSNYPSDNKIQFCANKEIIILTIGADYINKLNEHYYVLNTQRLEGNSNKIPKQKFDKVKDDIYKIVSEKDCIESKILREMIDGCSEDYHEYSKLFNEVLIQYNLYELSKYGYGVMNKLGVKGVRKLFIPKNKMEYFKSLDGEYEQKVEKLLRVEADKLNKEIDQEGHMSIKDYKEILENKLPEGYKTRAKKYRDYIDIEHIVVRYKDYKNELEGLGIKVKDGRAMMGSYILSRDVSKELNI